jgi:ubiquinone/menaquinone biosynthesis C-methylase UbiE
MSNQEDEVRRIFGARAAFYATSSSHTDPGVLSRVVAFAVPQPHWTALDIATGGGHTAFAMCEHVRAVAATDLTIEMLLQAESLRASRRIANVSFQVADVHALPFRTETFDLITCRRAAHHFSMIGHALGEMRRVLAPGGRVVIDDRSIPEDDFVDATMNLLDTCHDPSHVREYRPSEWHALLESLGFAVELLDLYVQHRPLTSLTKDASPVDAAAIHTTVAGLTAAQREALDLRDVHGEPYSNHWFIMLAARKL